MREGRRASSKKRTPPIAFVITFAALPAVQPRWPSTSAVRALSCTQTFVVATTPNPLSSRARICATVVLPVPGLPRNSMWLLADCGSAPVCSRTIKPWITESQSSVTVFLTSAISPTSFSPISASAVSLAFRAATDARGASSGKGASTTAGGRSAGVAAAARSLPRPDVVLPCTPPPATPERGPGGGAYRCVAGRRRLPPAATPSFARVELHCRPLTFAVQTSSLLGLYILQSVHIHRPLESGAAGAVVLDEAVSA